MYHDPKPSRKRNISPAFLGRMKIIKTKIEFCMGPQTEHKERVNNLWFTLQAMSSPHPQLYSKILPIPSPSHSKPLFSFVAQEVEHIYFSPSFKIKQKASASFLPAILTVLKSLQGSRCGKLCVCLGFNKTPLSLALLPVLSYMVSMKGLDQTPLACIKAAACIPML